MPYIKRDRRNEIDGILEPLLKLVKRRRNRRPTAGDINYIITKIIHERLASQDLKYAHINEMIGVLECAKLELYRMIGAPYEDNKIKANGSVSRLDAASESAKALLHKHLKEYHWGMYI